MIPVLSADLLKNQILQHKRCLAPKGVGVVLATSAINKLFFEILMECELKVHKASNHKGINSMFECIEEETAKLDNKLTYKYISPFITL